MIKKKSNWLIYFLWQPKLDIPWTLTSCTELLLEEIQKEVNKQKNMFTGCMQEWKETSLFLWSLLLLFLLVDIALVHAAPASLLPRVFICWRRSIKKVIYGCWWMAIGGAQTGSGRCRCFRKHSVPQSSQQTTTCGPRQSQWRGQ